MPLQSTETTIIGGGVVGLSVALGLLQTGQQVTVLDGADSDLRASQGNFGLVWLQGKGSNYPAYARWTSEAVSDWADFADLLTDLSDIDVHLEQPGGYEVFTEQSEFDEFLVELENQGKTLGKNLDAEILTGAAMRHRFPELGSKVVGATFCSRDGHVNPLKLLRALRIAVTRLGGQIISNATITNITPTPSGGFSLIDRSGQTFGAEQIVLCAGLGAMALAPQLGFRTRVRAQRGELLITEKIGSPLPFLSSTIRQVDEGGIQIGGTKADAGLDDGDTLEFTARLAQHAVEVFPQLEKTRILRSWGALRIMSDDGYPVYAQSSDHPGAFLVTCHSGITLAPNHAGPLAKWIANTSDAPNLEAFDESRFPFLQTV
ncbi:FAD-binding oxidoreductase [Sedimentitalea sp. CY04]|uniref:FAD-binding oxidoreductase n=1 Tax=Parasedimentitalea denitrificans TaxID=2211118 RepID=A0ABX0W7G0_9RHOB|nr:FAD-dependent oxidoreductase [Sedimentitalea sp. CY04]NIZ61569.1 FAD-binding oxidoreductase [Sedimentitalea sp. CY04]